MNACKRIFLSLTVVGLAVLAGPVPTADAQTIPYVGPGRGQARPPVQAISPVRPNLVQPVAPRPNWNTNTAIRPGVPVRPGAIVRPGLPVRPNTIIPPNTVVRPGVALRPNLAVRPNWAARPYATYPYANYWLGRGAYGWSYNPNWYAPAYGSWYYPGYVFRTPYTYYTNPTTYINVANVGFSGGFDAMVPTLTAGYSQSNLLQPSVFSILPTDDSQADLLQESVIPIQQ
jgi:hypothetical protein